MRPQWITPEAAFIADTTKVAPAEVLINTTYRNSYPATWAWDFGDGTTSAVADPVKQFGTGSYLVSLTVTEGTYGETSTYSKTVNMLAPAVSAAFSFVTTSVASPSSASFTNASTYTGHGTLTYLWDFGSGSLSTSSANPSPVVYKSAGTYIIRLAVTESSYNYKSQLTRSFVVT
jgi:PKD repeat protein